MCTTTPSPLFFVIFHGMFPEPLGTSSHIPSLCLWMKSSLCFQAFENAFILFFLTIFSLNVEFCAGMFSSDPLKTSSHSLLSPLKVVNSLCQLYLGLPARRLSFFSGCVQGLLFLFGFLKSTSHIFLNTYSTDPGDVSLRFYHEWWHTP